MEGRWSKSTQPFRDHIRLLRVVIAKSTTFTLLLSRETLKQTVFCCCFSVLGKGWNEDVKNLIRSNFQASPLALEELLGITNLTIT